MVENSVQRSPIQALVVHEWFASIGGSENVAAAISETFPGSDLLCLWREGDVPSTGGGQVLESSLSVKPFRGRKILSLPLMPIVWRFTKARSHNAAVAIVSSHLFAHHVAVPKRTPKLVYVHTPARYVWEPEFDRRGNNLAAKFASAFLKPLDKFRAREATALAANSEFVRARIKSAWGLDARVIYPPVDTEEIQAVSDWSTQLSPKEQSVLQSLPTDFVLGASRFIPYKRLDLAIRGGELSGLPVVIAGQGPEEQTLRALAAQASVPVHFVVAPSNQLLRALYQRAGVYVFPPVEDFGIMPVESIACGTPVAANALGGASESVIDGLSGAHFVPDDDASLLSAIGRALPLKSPRLSQYAETFSKSRFQREVRTWVDEFVGQVAVAKVESSTSSPNK